MSLQEQMAAALARKRKAVDPRVRATRDALATWLPANELIIGEMPEGPERDAARAEWETYLEAYQKIAAAIGEVRFDAELVE